MRTTAVFESYWQFAAERLFIYYRRLAGEAGPWTSDPILQAYRFTNSYRAADRVSQYLIREVQYGEGRSHEPDEVFFRTILFKLFNKIDTWEALERAHGPLCWRTVNLDALEQTLDALMGNGERIYSAAYIMPAPPFGAQRKHSNHLRLIAMMMNDRLPGRIRQASDLQTVYDLLVGCPGVGRFLAFQFAIDLNYSSMLDFDESSFVIAGPGALDGISKCFIGAPHAGPERIIHWMTERQEEEFAKRDINFPGLFGRMLQPIDCQNLFCEISKYSRVAHPGVKGVADRTRIKQVYRKASVSEPAPFFPPRWGLDTNQSVAVPCLAFEPEQPVLI